ncbi:hypothetical protein A2U01_0089879, partial [Trifolium medium]|nr:hypothetical protein [Trifolium medium]
RSRQRSTIIIVHAEQDAQLAIGCSRLEEESQTTAPFLGWVWIATPDTRIGSPNLSSAVSTTPAVKR